MMVVLLESGGCTVRCVQYVLFLSVSPTSCTQTDVTSLMKATGKLK